MVLVRQVTLKIHVTIGFVAVFIGGSIYGSICGWEQLKVSYHQAKFDSHRHWVSGDIMVSVCHVTLKDHIIKASYEFMGRSSSR